MLLTAPIAWSGPYSAALNDPTNPFDAPVPGFIGPHGIGKARIESSGGSFQNPNNRVNPLFFAWASDYSDYFRSDGQAQFSDPQEALGQVTGDNFYVVSLGDMTQEAIDRGDPPGSITLHFAKPIHNLSGADFVIFENGFISQFSTGGAGVGGFFAELAYVEVSNDGINFLRFDSRSLTATAVGTYGSIHPSNIYNLAGKHVNAYGDSWGTPFDIGQLGLDRITHIRLVDIPGNGSFKDGAEYSIFDAWRTTGSGGFDLEAAGSISIRIRFSDWPLLAELPADQRGENDDPDEDGIPNLLEYAFCLMPDERDAPDAGWRHEIVSADGEQYMEIISRRDERLEDLIREVQVSVDLEQWDTIATSTAGAAYEAAPGFTPEISDISASEIASVGVIREDRVRDTRPLRESEKRFYRLKITRQ